MQPRLKGTVGVPVTAVCFIAILPSSPPDAEECRSFRIQLAQINKLPR